MKGFRVLVFLWPCLVVRCACLFGQTPSLPVDARQYEYFDFVPMPQFKGGDTAAIHFFSTHIPCPPRPGIFHRKDTVIVSFVAQKGGFISDVKVIRGKRSRQRQTVLNAVNAMPRFTAAESAGFHPRVLYCVAVAFDWHKRARQCADIFFFKAGAKNMYNDKEWISWVRIR